MKHLIKCLVLLILTATYGNLAAQSAGNSQVLKWTVGDTQREATVYIPKSAKSKPTPVVFLFHGHGGNMADMFRNHGFDKLWPEAIIVVPQGLPTPGQLVDRAGKFPGWQQGPGDMQDRDLLFFDEMLRTLKNDYQIDSKRIYATGHSNGGGFTYLLWAMRGDVFTAMAPSAAVAFRFNNLLSPKPVMHIMGAADPLVKTSWQEMQIARLLKINHCSAEGQPYGNSATIYASANGYPVIVFKHPGGHIYPPEADAAVISFFKSTVKN